MSKTLLREFYALCEGGICQDLLTEDEKKYVSDGGINTDFAVAAFGQLGARLCRVARPAPEVPASGQPHPFLQGG